MKYLKRTHFIWLLVSISFLLYIGALYVFPVAQRSLWQYCQRIPAIVTIDVVLAYGFSRWFWQWKIWHPWLVPFPNLNGTWKGEIRSEWINPKTNKKLAPIPAQLIVEQSFLEIRCTMKTKEMTSESFNAAFDMSKSMPQLIYSYTSKTKANVTNRSPTHDGTMVFEFTNEGSKKLEGEYWTKRQTTGRASFSFRGKRKEYDFLDTAIHPAEEAEKQATQQSSGNVYNYGTVNHQINHADTGNDLNFGKSQDQKNQSS
jgi:hypothetical protein